MQAKFLSPGRFRFARVLLAAALVAAAGAASAAGTLDKARDSGKLVIGHYAAIPPFVYGASGKPAGYAIALCDKVGQALKAQLNLPALAVEYVPVTVEEGFRAVQEGRIDLLCGASPSLERRALVDFSIPIVLSGTSAAIRRDAPKRLAEVLEGRERADGPVWRGSTDQAPQRVRLAVVGGTPVEKLLGSRLKERRLIAEIIPVKDVDAGLQLLGSQGADAVFMDRALLLHAVTSVKSPGNVQVLDKVFRRDVVALAMRRNDDDFRLLVDGALSRSFRSPEMKTLYTTYFGPPTPAALEFFDLVAVPD